MSFGQRLRQERRRLYLSQEALAEALSTSPKSINRWEQDQAMPQGQMRLRLCRFFHLRPEDLFVEFEEKKPPTRIWSVPYSRNPFFTGREEVLHALHTQLHQECAIALTQSLAISGLGGIGKTQIVLEYAYRYRQDYHFIFWTHAATRETLQTDIVTIAELLQLPERNTQDQKKVIQAVRNWFALHQQWLWILDNIDDVTMLHDILPAERPGHLLLTSRAQAWGSLAQRVDVKTMETVDGTLFLLRRAKQLAPDGVMDQIASKHLHTAETIAREMDFLPLALDQAGAYIEEVGCSLADYLKLYQKHRKELLQRRGQLPNDHPEPVATTWSLSFQQVEQVNPATADLLRLCAFLEPDTIPEELISAGSVFIGQDAPHEAINALALNKIIEELRKFSLIQRDPETRLFHLHRLVQAVLKDDMNRDTQCQWAERAVRATNSAFPQQIEVSTWSDCQLLLAQAQSCSALIQEYAFTFQEATALILRTASYLLAQGLYQQAEPLYQQALRILEQQLTPEDPSLALPFNELAQVYQKQGKYEQAVHLFQRAIHMQEHVSERFVALPLYGLGDLYLEQGKYEQAEPLFQRAFTIWEHESSPDYAQKSSSLMGLSLVYLRQGKYEQAESLMRETLAIRERYLSEDRLTVARSLHNLALLYWQQGKYEQAAPLLQRSLTFKEQILGAEHPDIARSLHNLAALYWQQGKFKQAEPLFQRAISISELRLGTEHPDTAISLQGLALLYELQEKYEQAEPLFQRTLLIFERHYGDENVETGRNAYNLAKLYLRQGKLEQAEPLFQRALAIREQHLMPDHTDVAESLYGLAKLYLRQGKLEQSELLHLRALAIREQLLETAHPDIAESLYGLAELYQQQENYTQAEPYYLRAVRIRENQQLLDHPDTAQVLSAFAAFLAAQGKSQEAASFYQRALAIRENVFGAEHPTTVATRTAYFALL